MLAPDAVQGRMLCKHPTAPSTITLGYQGRRPKRLCLACFQVLRDVCIDYHEGRADGRRVREALRSRGFSRWEAWQFRVGLLRTSIDTFRPPQVAAPEE